MQGKVGRRITVWLRLAGIGLLFAAVGVGCFSLRRRFIATWFRDATPASAPRLQQPGVGSAREVVAAPHSPPPRLRVLLIDGLGLGPAQSLPALSRFCAGGTDLTIDVGFPTVSLPVQAALWTGLTQAQLGLLYRVKALAQAPTASLPVRVPGSVAIAEDQPFIAGSFGFTSVLPPAVDPSWADTGFRAAAAANVVADAPLVFVHVLRVDKAGHKFGAASAAYDAAAAWADGLVDELQQQAPPREDRRWVILSDHGHQPGGGHAGAEADIRLVRACVRGGPALFMPATLPLSLPPSSSAAHGLPPVHLIDLARLLVDTLGLSPAEGAVGRPLDFALTNPDAGLTLPVPAHARDLGALAFWVVLTVLVALGLRRHAGRCRIAWWPLFVPWLWLPVALVSVFALRGAPSLSTPAIYPPQGRDLWLAAIPGFVFLLVALGAASRRFQRQSSGSTSTSTSTGFPPDLPLPLSTAAIAMAAWLPGALAAVALLHACGAFNALGDPGAGPPLSMRATPLASMLLAIEGGAAIVLAICVTVSGALTQLRRGGPRS